MKKVSAGRLRVALANGDILEYLGVPQETFRRLEAANSMGSFFRDNIEEEYSARRVR